MREHRLLCLPKHNTIAILPTVVSVFQIKLKRTVYHFIFDTVDIFSLSLTEPVCKKLSYPMKQIAAVADDKLCWCMSLCPTPLMLYAMNYLVISLLFTPTLNPVIKENSNAPMFTLRAF